MGCGMPVRVVAAHDTIPPPSAPLFYSVPSAAVGGWLMEGLPYAVHTRCVYGGCSRESAKGKQRKAQPAASEEARQKPTICHGSVSKPYTVRAVHVYPHAHLCQFVPWLLWCCCCAAVDMAVLRTKCPGVRGSSFACRHALCM